MSFGRSKTKAFEAEFSQSCKANYCPWPGSISNDGSRFFCACHHMSQPEKWSFVTEKLRDNEHIRLALIDILKMDDATWIRNGWQMMERFFDDDKELQPSVAERERKGWFEYRIRDMLAYRCGVIARPPKPRDVAAHGQSLRRKKKPTS